MIIKIYFIDILIIWKSKCNNLEVLSFDKNGNTNISK